ncbi:MAG TPA: SDR family NAD(P)-dependent oxidoreductase, partial [Casimicrobiaceae bacterium]|nr:SDR family NAD(P)-dependent oxidoreductase [Casimicrobiaceae bacterium]
MQIDGNIFFVTGAASGLGAASARMIVANGGRVVLADIGDAGGTALAAELGESARFVKTDVADEASARAAVAAGLAAFGALHGVINCAGVAIGEKILGKEGPHVLASFTRVIQINLIGSFNLTRLAAESMSKNAPNADGE